MTKRKGPPAADLIWTEFNQQTTNVCICPKCGLILRPVGGECTYRHCGQIWTLQGRYAKRLPTDFWDHHTYGDKAPAFYRPEPDGPDTATAADQDDEDDAA
jgi:hypothetical protein